MANSKLLKEAIADAKAVKETALANAKLALEEAFTPRLQSILSQKLRAEAEEVGDDETEKMQEELDSSDIGASDGKEPSGFDAHTDLQGVKSKGGQVGSELSDYKKVKEISEEENPYGDDMEGGKDAEIAELKARLAELEGEDDEMGDMGDENDMSDEFSMGDMGDMEGGSDDDFESDDSYDGEDSEDDMDLESIIRELEAQMSGDDSDQEEMPEDEPMGENYSDGSEAGTDKGETPKVFVTNEGDGENDDDVIDLEEILREMEADMKDGKEKVEEEEDKEEMKKDLQEAYKTIKSLQSTINEVNLLNAKLLFANKLFRAHNMTNEQKVKVIETLDRTKSVREVKLVYSTLAENFKYTSNTSKVAKKSITEGIASKVTKSTKPAASKQVIAESTNFSDRFKKLAGIIK
jgi:hypothetical protein